MAHFAEIDENNIVVQVIVVSNDKLLDDNGIESEERGLEFLRSIPGFENKRFVQTSYNRRKRYNFAGVGYKWDEVNDAIVAPKPDNPQEKDIEILGEYVLNQDFQWEYTGKIKPEAVKPTSEQIK